MKTAREWLKHLMKSFPSLVIVLEAKIASSITSLFSNVVHTHGSSNIQLWKITHQQAKQYVFTVIIIYKLKIPIQH